MTAITINLNNVVNEYIAAKVRLGWLIDRKNRRVISAC
ncbi:Uma2 family endonuclease [Aetokthonos hydrillicola Thurmond2011]|uniref:Uma2 family endonuclease n=1 Tax=Aetokthonos hydrillicola Thurmond2011 TaxID=2712845 RepID=A0AAP5IER8_9CYAN|nr:Uma2 family endonuclease [Aetokthonos hydrillicola]MBW4586386.1 Uma2 family endonuclease [Aetokthonos hydrillicola CCALA 1050]MDR9899909.1 Uma2 family endonuclease [Aetokthonos hydrillicola Thurmond2011]